jgi:hypothetical protein
MPPKKEKKMDEDPRNQVDFRIDRSNLYREEAFTDLKVGTIKCLTPIKSDGSEDKTRKKIFVGNTNVMTQQGPIPIQGMIKAKELQQAVKKFPEAMEAAMDRLVEEAQKYQEQQAKESQIQKPDSRIIIPGR